MAVLEDSVDTKRTALEAYDGEDEMPYLINFWVSCEDEHVFTIVARTVNVIDCKELL